MTVVSYGIYFDGRCCLCRDWITPYGQWQGPTTVPPAQGVRHERAHRSCAAACGDERAVASIAEHPSEDDPAPVPQADAVPALRAEEAGR